jgi:hypothetical protein
LTDPIRQAKVAVHAAPTGVCAATRDVGVADVEERTPQRPET